MQRAGVLGCTGQNTVVVKVVAIIMFTVVTEYRILYSSHDREINGVTTTHTELMFWDAPAKM